MRILYNNYEYLELLQDIRKNYRTVYGWGAFGAWSDYKNNRSRYNVPNAPKDSYIFDCSGFAYKAIPWGWCGKQTCYGGATYKKIPELETNNILQICFDVSTNFDNVQVSEVLYMPGHVGIYAGDGNVIECTTAGSGGVIMSTLANAKRLHGYNWQSHGKLAFIEYIDRYAKCCENKRKHGDCPGCNIIV